MRRLRKFRDVLTAEAHASRLISWILDLPLEVRYRFFSIVQSSAPEPVLKRTPLWAFVVLIVGALTSFSAAAVGSYHVLRAATCRVQQSSLRAH